MENQATKEEIVYNLIKSVQQGKYCEDVKSVSIFGSYAHGTPHKDSDVDVLIEFVPGSKIGFFDLVRIQDNMQKQTKKKIDLITRDGVSDLLQESILSDVQKIYEQR